MSYNLILAGCHLEERDVNLDFFLDSVVLTMNLH